MKKLCCLILAAVLLLLTGYIPNTQSYDYGCYESHTSNFTRETGDELVEAYISMLEQLNS